MNYLVKMLLLLLLCYPVLASPCSFVCSLLQLPMTFNPNCSEWRKTTSQEVQEISAQDVLLLYFYFLFFCFSCLNMYYVCGCSFCKTFWRGRRERDSEEVSGREVKTEEITKVNATLFSFRKRLHLKFRQWNETILSLCLP